MGWFWQPRRRQYRRQALPQAALRTCHADQLRHLTRPMLGAVLCVAHAGDAPHPLACSLTSFVRPTALWVRLPRQHPSAAASRAGTRGTAAHRDRT